MSAFGWGVTIGVFAGAAIAYVVMDIFRARESDPNLEKLKECAAKAIKADVMHLLGPFPAQELITAIANGVDPLIAAARQLEKVHPDVRSGEENQPKQ
jgi:hypothetical protein